MPSWPGYGHLALAFDSPTNGREAESCPDNRQCFRATVNAQGSIDEGEGVSFHTTLPEDRCVRLLVKKLGRGMTESVVWEELESLDIRVHGVTKLRSGRRD